MLCIVPLFANFHLFCTFFVFFDRISNFIGTFKIRLTPVKLTFDVYNDLSSKLLAGKYVGLVY